MGGEASVAGEIMMMSSTTHDVTLAVTHVTNLGSDQS